MVTPCHTMHLGSRVHSLKGDPPPQTMYFESHIYSPQGNHTSQTLNLGSHVQSLGDTISQNLHLGSHVHSVQCEPNFQTLYLGHMSTVFRVTPLPDPVPGKKYLQRPK